MLIELPNGDWTDPKAVIGLRLLDDKTYGPRVIIETTGQNGAHLVSFDDADAAKGWVKKFGADCNEAALAV